jgi:hypothetical protein
MMLVTLIQMSFLMSIETRMDLSTEEELGQIILKKAKVVVKVVKEEIKMRTLTRKISITLAKNSGTKMDL